jgi:acyl-CoA synthetase (AMP-forming)/AMP-acid ligase II
MTDPRAYIAATVAALTAPGAEFEISEQTIRGVRMRAFANATRPLNDLLAASVEFGDREYLVRGDQRMTFAQHARAVASLAHTLRNEYGVQPGDRVAILAANAPHWVVTFFATAGIGAITSAFNAWWTPREVAYAIGHSRPSVIVVDAKRRPLLPEGLDVPVLDIDDLPLHADVPLPTTTAELDDPAVIIYTSGTTGHPKGATHSHRNLLAVVQYHRMNDAIATALGMAPPVPRRFLMSLPLFHIASLHNLVLPRLVTGDTVVIAEGGFDVDRVLRLIERERITNWAVVPTMAHRIVEHGDLSTYDLSSLVALSVNSAPSSPALKERLRDAVPNIRTALADSYGLTEASTAATVASAMDLAEFPTTVGSPVATVAIEIRDADGKPLPDGDEGEICLRSPFTMLGYWDDPDATRAVLDDDGWLHTGDIGSLRDGRLYMSTRRSDLILRGGENVYPAEIEAVLDAHPGVAESAVFGVDDPDLGQAVAAVVVVAPGAPVTAAELATHVADHLAYYKVPAHWRLTDQPLARTATGKVVRRSLQL